MPDTNNTQLSQQVHAVPYSCAVGHVRVGCS